MLKNRFLLGAVAFGVSFGINLLTTRDAGKAILTGLTTVPAAVIAAIVVERRILRQAGNRISTLKRQIHALQKQRSEVYRALQAMRAGETCTPNPNPFQPDITLLQVPVPVTSPTLSRTGATKALSWDLSAPSTVASTIEIKPHELPTAMQPTPALDVQAQQLHQAETTLNHLVTDANAAKRKIEGQLNLLEKELKQLQQQVADQRKRRDKLTQEVASLEQQTQQLTQNATALRNDVADLECCRTELEQFLAYAEGKKQELETGSHPLQIALKQLQLQESELRIELQQLEAAVGERRAQQQTLDQQLADHPAQTALKQLQTQCSKFQEELFLLDSQIDDRRLQKEALEQQLATLQAQATLPALDLEPPGSHQNGSNGHSGTAVKAMLPPNKLPAESAVQGETSVIASAAPSIPTESAKAATAALQRPKKLAVKPAAKTAEPLAEKNHAGLADEWAEFMVQLPDYEFMVLKAIAEQRNVAGIIKKIAEDNLTMPELLIDTINERALDIVGDIVIEPNAGAATAAIAREHQKAVKRLIKTYEYLTE